MNLNSNEWVITIIHNDCHHVFYSSIKFDQPKRFIGLLLCLSSNCFIGILFSDRPTKQLEDKSRKQSNRTIRATGLPILGF